MAIEIEPAQVEIAHQKLIDDEGRHHSPALVEEALELWLDGEVIHLIEDCTNHSNFLRWLDYLEKRTPKPSALEVKPSCACREDPGDNPACQTHHGAAVEVLS